MLCASGGECLLVKPNSKCAILYASGQMPWPKKSGGNTPAFKLQPPQEDDSLRFAYYRHPIELYLLRYTNYVVWRVITDAADPLKTCARHKKNSAAIFLSFIPRDVDVGKYPTGTTR